MLNISRIRIAVNKYHHGFSPLLICSFILKIFTVISLCYGDALCIKHGTCLSGYPLSKTVKISSTLESRAEDFYLVLGQGSGEKQEVVRLPGLCDM